MLSFARVRALAILTVLIVGAIIAVVLAFGRDGDNPAVAGCPDGWPLADLTVRKAQEIKINVYNGSGAEGLAADIAANFANREFQVLEHGTDPLETEVEGVALLRYGPAGVGSAQLLKAYFLNNAETEFQVDREGDEVDVVLGAGFRQLATPTEVSQSIAAIGSPQLPPRTCLPED